jgi:DNA polymerase III epsilon subunit-like protein
MHGGYLLNSTTTDLEWKYFKLLWTAQDQNHKDTFNVIAWDVETTGLDPKEDRIISIAAAIATPLRPTQIKVYHTLINPNIPNFVMPKAAYKVHGISEQDLIGKPTISNIKGFIKWALDKQFVVGHNSTAFDMEILKAELARSGDEDFIPEPAIHIDTMKLMKTEYRSHKANLAAAWTFAHSIHNINGIWDKNKAHDACFDAIKALELFAMLGAKHPWQTQVYHSKRKEMIGQLASWVEGHWFLYKQFVHLFET